MNDMIKLSNIAQPSLQWKDKKYYAWMLSPTFPLIAMSMMSLYQFNPKRFRALSWTGPILLYAAFPLLDMLIGEDSSNPPESAIKALEENPYYANLVKAFVPVQMLLNLYTAYLYKHKATSWVDKIGLIATTGLLNGVGINTAHELSHKQGKLERLIGLAALAPTGYAHFLVEHPFGHHKRVATPEDPASSAMGQTFWEFMPKSIIESFKSSLQIESKRLARKGTGFWSYQNEILQGGAMTAAYIASMVSIFGRSIVPFTVAQAVYGFHFLEVANYIEHYGLLRQKNASGLYERTKPEHSWNSNTLLTNLVIFQLQRHSDHHAYPTRSYQALRHFDNTPQLPTGYGPMFLLAYFPKLWFSVMDKRVANHYKGDLTKAHIKPSARERLFKKFHRPE